MILHGGSALTTSVPGAPKSFSDIHRHMVHIHTVPEDLIPLLVVSSTTDHTPGAHTYTWCIHTLLKYTQNKMSVNISSVYSSSTRAVSYEIELRNKHKMIKGAFWSTEESQIALYAPCKA